MKKGFTLAEVLITLGIIGVVAALTIPGLVANYQEKVTVTKLKKAYTTLSNAYSLAAIEQGDPLTWFSSTDSETVMTKKFFDNLKPHLQITKDCNGATGCLSTAGTKLLHGTSFDNPETDTRYQKIILADGVAVSGIFSYPNAKDDEPLGKTKCK
jgi:prepilin-type N-terminal cleavage/methylation domain-containing protein